MNFTIQRSGKQPSSAQTISLLRWLGVEPRLLEPARKQSNSAVGSFWKRRINYLEVLEAAKACYRAQVKRFHPDLNGGCERVMRELTGAWGAVKRIFKQRGYALE